MSKFSTLLTALTFSLVATSLFAAEPVSDAALARARKQAEMLDTLYKTAVVAVTQTYVEDETDVAAATAFKGLFAVMKEKGYHEARLLDATGSPYEETNAPQTGFETEAIKALKKGAATHEEVTTINGKPVLRIATPVPVVLEKCTMCHAHYAKVKPGEVIGALSYIIPIE
ncbi:MAG: DUF3365 domain-containing protein [Planctomycetaceae bacterium]